MTYRLACWWPRPLLLQLDHSAGVLVAAQVVGQLLLWLQLLARKPQCGGFWVKVHTTKLQKAAARCWGVEVQGQPEKMLVVVVVYRMRLAAALSLKCVSKVVAMSHDTCNH